jgi:hypothetical protein
MRTKLVVTIFIDVDAPDYISSTPAVGAVFDRVADAALTTPGVKVLAVSPMRDDRLTDDDEARFVVQGGPS